MSPLRACLALGLLALALGLSGGPALAQDDLATAREEMLARLAREVEEQARLERGLAEAAQDLEAVEERLTRTRARLAAMPEEKARLADRMALVEAQIKGLGRLAGEQEQGFHQRLRALYIHGADLTPAAMASSQDLSGAFTHGWALGRLLEADRRRMAALTKRREELAALRTELAYRQNELVALSQEEAARREELEQAAQERARLVARLRARRQEQEVAIAALRAGQERLARTLALASTAPATAARNHRGEAVAPPVEGRVVGRGGPARRGVVLAAREHAPVRAPWGGSVAYADALAGYGRVVVLDHGGRLHTVLGHLGAVSVEPGQKVAPGQVVGSLDSSGRLYLELRQGTRPVDPVAWLGLKP